MSTSNAESDMQRLLKPPEVAELLGVSVATIYAMVAAKKIVVCRVGAGRGVLRFRPEDVDDFLTQTSARARRCYRHLQF